MKKRQRVAAAPADGPAQPADAGNDKPSPAEKAEKAAVPPATAPSPARPTPLSPSRSNNRPLPEKLLLSPHAPKTPSSLRMAVLPAGSAERDGPDSSPTAGQENVAPTADTPSNRASKHPPKPPKLATESSPHTPTNPPDPSVGLVTPQHHRPSLNPYLSQAKRLFRRSTKPQRLVGREKERAALAELVENAKAGRTEALYVAGCPGSGKTALVRDVLKTTAEADGSPLRVVFVNCMSLQTPQAVWSRILEELEGVTSPTTPTGKGKAVKQVESILLGEEEPPSKKRKASQMKSDKKYLLVLDEVDYLAKHASTMSSGSSKSDEDSDALIRIFSWPRRAGSKVSVIGIANALDLTERVCGRLKMAGWEPQVLHFVPYTVEEISAIIKDRLDSAAEADGIDSKEPLMQPQAILLAARKCAGTGDLRKALDVCRQAIELYEADLRQQSPFPSSPTTPTGSAAPSPAVVPKITLRHINQVTTASLGAASTGSEKIRNLSFIQKTLLMTVWLARKKAKQNAPNKVGGSKTTGAVSLKQIFAEFDNLALKKLHIPTVSRTELQDIIMTLQTYSLVARASASGTGRASTPKDTDSFRLEISESALKIGLEDPLAAHEDEAAGNKGGTKLLLRVYEEQERLEKRLKQLGGEGDDLAEE
ncbi:P-loop containing nucleoside triphosphate hydrolase protein [Hyaloraphidium curvatum]|nr:P-loop containing nucleoside triphosphate hydrolase protein [Hyaloraphidium curvatum]